MEGLIKEKSEIIKVRRQAQGYIAITLSSSLLRYLVSKQIFVSDRSSRAHVKPHFKPKLKRPKPQRSKNHAIMALD